MNTGQFNFSITHFNSLKSTNIYAQELLQAGSLMEGSVISTDFQEQGKGQRGNFWEAEPSKNLLFSLLLKPNLAVENQFLLSKVVALGVKKALDTLSVGKVSIKWPNDILVANRKLGGILIENFISGGKIGDAIVGVGLNINQSRFSLFPREATSLLLESGQLHRPEEVLALVLEGIKEYYLLLDNKVRVIDEAYLNALYGYGVPMHYEDKEGPFRGVIMAVAADGKLQVNKNGKLKKYDLKELIFTS